MHDGERKKNGGDVKSISKKEARQGTDGQRYVLCPQCRAPDRLIDPSEEEGGAVLCHHCDSPVRLRSLENVSENEDDHD